MMPAEIISSVRFALVMPLSDMEDAVTSDKTEAGIAAGPELSAVWSFQDFPSVFTMSASRGWNGELWFGVSGATSAIELGELLLRGMDWVKDKSFESSSTRDVRVPTSSSTRDVRLATCSSMLSFHLDSVQRMDWT
jgi:hypothetical protein